MRVILHVQEKLSTQVVLDHFDCNAPIFKAISEAHHICSLVLML